MRKVFLSSVAENTESRLGTNPEHTTQPPNGRTQAAEHDCFPPIPLLFSRPNSLPCPWRGMSSLFTWYIYGDGSLLHRKHRDTHAHSAHIPFSAASCFISGCVLSYKSISPNLGHIWGTERKFKGASPSQRNSPSLGFFSCKCHLCFEN